MKGLFIPEITSEMFRNGCLESIEQLMTEGKIYDIDYPLEQEPCEDAISRQTVLDQTYLWSKDEFLRVTNPFDYLRKRINSLPSVKPQEPKWIPVSERLPEVNQRVLVTSYGRVCYAMMISADANSGHPVFKLQDSLNERVVCETTVHNEFTTSRIKAWMPLPEPYKAESEG